MLSLMSKTCEYKLLLKHTLKFVVNLETEDKRLSIRIWLMLLLYLSSYFVTEEMKTDYRFSFHKKEKADDQMTPIPYSKQSFILHY